MGNSVMMLNLGNIYPWASYKQHGTESRRWEKSEHDRDAWCHDTFPAERHTWISKRYAGDGAEIDAFPIGCPMQLGLKRGRLSDISLALNVSHGSTEVLVDLKLTWHANSKTSRLISDKLFTLDLPDHFTDSRSFIPYNCTIHYMDKSLQMSDHHTSILFFPKVGSTQLLYLECLCTL